MPTMLVTRIPFWRLRQHGVVEEAVRGGSRRRIGGRDWPLPEPVRERMRGLLAPLGFDLMRPILVAEPEDERPWSSGRTTGATGTKTPRARSPRRRRSLLRHQDDLDAAVLGAAFQRRVVRDRLELAEGGGGEAGRLDALLLQIAGDVDRAPGRKLPVGRIALHERTHDGLFVRVPLDADRFIAHRFEDLDDLAEDDEPLGLHLRSARIEEDRFDHVDGELALQLRDGHLPLVDLTFHLRDELLVGRADLAHLLLARLLG